MSPAFKYSYGRLGLFLLCLLLLLPTPLNILVKAMVALLVSAVLGLFVLRRWRDQMGEQLSAAAARRTAEKQRLRAALAGDEEAAAAGDRVAAVAAARWRDDEDEDARQGEVDSKAQATTASNAAKASAGAAAAAVDAVKSDPTDDHDADTPVEEKK